MIVIKNNNINYRKNIVRELHTLKHRKKYLYQTLYHSTEKRYPEDYEYFDSLKREYDVVKDKIELLENLCQ